MLVDAKRFAVIILLFTALGHLATSSPAWAIDPLIYDVEGIGRRQVQLALTYRPLGFEAPSVFDRSEHVEGSVHLAYPAGERVRIFAGVAGGLEVVFTRLDGTERRAASSRVHTLRLGAEWTVAGRDRGRIVLTPVVDVHTATAHAPAAIGYSLGLGVASIRDPLALGLELFLKREAGDDSLTPGLSGRVLFVINERYSLEHSLAVERPPHRPVATRWGMHFHYRTASRHLWRAGLELTVQGEATVPALTLSRTVHW